MSEIKVYKIDGGVPMPDKGTALPPIRQLEIGESILFPLNKRASVQSLASHVRRDTGRRFKVQKQDNNTARVWRVE